MDDLWQQFHRLPKAIRDAVSRPEALAAVDSLEQRYPSLDLASFVMRAVVKEFPIGELAARLQQEYSLPEHDANAVADELSVTIFSEIKEYLGLFPTQITAQKQGPSATQQEHQPVGASLTSIRLPTAPANLPVAAPQPRPSLTPTPVAAPRPPVAVPQPTSASAIIPSSSTAPAPATGPVAPTQAYSDDDAAEIAQQARRLQGMTSSGAVSLDEIAQEIINQHHLAFHDELLAKRAVAILKARLKDIRDKDETLMMLVRGPKVGGLGLDQDLAKNAESSLEQHVGRVKERGLVQPPQPIAPPPPPAMPPMKVEKPEPKPPFFRTADAAANARPGMPPLPAAPPPEPVQAVRPPPPIKRPSDIPQPSAMKPAAAPAVPKPPTVVTRPRTIERPAIADITRPTKMLGPAEEMRTLTLMEFRRLGQGANESTRRLLEKFADLQRESFTIWSDAIQGWRQSEVYQLYLAMGRQSMEQAKGITEVIKQRAAANQLYLSEHEFTALADMNQQLQS